jgi:hypothetical protein
MRASCPYLPLLKRGIEVNSMFRQDFELEMVLHAAKRSLLAIEEARRALDIQHRDLSRQIEWLRGEIDKASTGKQSE